MPTQVLEPNRDESLVIITPAGPIRLTKLKGAKWRIETPDGMIAQRGEERALKDNPYLRRNERGFLEPLYRMLIPKLDEKGSLHLEPVDSLSLKLP